MAASASDVVRVAAGELDMGGVRWSGNPRGSYYCDWFGTRDLWCAMFVSWCADQAGATDIIPRHSWTVDGRNWFIAKGQWFNGTAGIRKGDIIYFKFAGNNVVNHVGIVEGVNPNGTIQTIEGNTGTSEYAGGTVARKTRSTNIVGYGRPNYTSSQEDDMTPIEMLTAQFEVSPGRWVSVADALKAVYFYGDRSELIPQRVWEHQLTNSATGVTEPAGTVLRTNRAGAAKDAAQKVWEYQLTNTATGVTEPAGTVLRTNRAGAAGDAARKVWEYELTNPATGESKPAGTILSGD